MDMNLIKENAGTLASHMQWLATVIDTRMRLYWEQACDFQSISEIPIPASAGDTSVFSQVLRHYQMDMTEQVILLLALAPHVQPHLLDVFFKKNADYDRFFTEVGGVRGQNHSGFIPTGETVSFILAPNDFYQRFILFDVFGPDHCFNKFNILKLDNPHPGEPLLSGVLRISAEYLSLFTLGESKRPDFSTSFPAKRLATGQDWDDLVLEEETLREVQEIQDWIIYGPALLEDPQMKTKIKPGFRALFYGPPGTGKTLTASLLGKATGLDVYRIDLSMVVSKYIGETEKNLANIFDQAETKNWILFFDEADSLFGKRTQTSSSNDRHANQEVSYLLQRVEDFPGVVILATNFKANMDEAFNRRFQTMIYFAVPGYAQRKLLWRKAFSGKTVLEPQLANKLDEIANKYEVTGGAIINVVRYSSLMALKRKVNVLLYEDVLTGIRREYYKDGKTI
jgi:hypothetical protein